MNRRIKKLKVLSIGNSFSVDGMQYIYEIAKNLGVKEVVLGNLYIGGASLSDHINQIENKKSDYIYYKNTTGIWEEKYNATLLEGLHDEVWDIISFQQVSYLSGKADSFEPELSKLIQYVNSYVNKENVDYIWHMTWAYQKNADHGGFKHYDNNQMKMFQSITKANHLSIEPRTEFKYIIPSGTAIQNMRTTEVGDTLTRDGFHLSFDLGRFIASLCWVYKITGLNIDNLTFKPKGVTDKQCKLAIASVKKAIQNPYTSEDIKI